VRHGTGKRRGRDTEQSNSTRCIAKKILLLLLLLLGDTLLGAYVNKYSVMHINCL